MDDGGCAALKWEADTDRYHDAARLGAERLDDRRKQLNVPHSSAVAEAIEGEMPRGEHYLRSGEARHLTPKREAPYHDASAKFARRGLTSAGTFAS